MCPTSAVCCAANHHHQQPAVAAGSFIGGSFSTSQTSGHLSWICVPFKEICVPALKSVCLHQQDENRLVSRLPLGCFYRSDRRRQVLMELLPLGLTSWRADQWENLLIRTVRKELYGKCTNPLNLFSVGLSHLLTSNAIFSSEIIMRVSVSEMLRCSPSSYPKLIGIQ